MPISFGTPCVVNGVPDMFWIRHDGEKIELCTVKNGETSVIEISPHQLAVLVADGAAILREVSG